MLKELIERLFKIDDSTVVEPEPTGQPLPFSVFVPWLQEVGEAAEPMSANRLWAAYSECALYHEVPTMTKNRFHRGLRAAGIQKVRLGTGDRKWVYVLKPQKRALRLVA